MQPNYTAFYGPTRLANGSLPDIARRAKQLVDQDPAAALSVFADADGQPVELDLRGEISDVLARLQNIESKHPLKPAAEESAEAPRTPGRPKLGVVAREVTLLPRHWDWLAAQPGGASVTLRKLVEQARKQGAEAGLARQAREAAYRFMHAMAGNQAGFEEASRALFAGDAAAFDTHTAGWPADVRAYANQLAAAGFNP